MENKEILLTELFNLSEHIRYIALYDEGALLMKQRDDILNVSSNESDKYEELIVNPALIKLCTQRGNIDCGGLDYLIIRYGNFYVLLTPCKNGHVNLGIEPHQDPIQFVEPLKAILGKYKITLER